MIFDKILWTIKRHPFLYLTRFKLLSRNSSIVDIENFNYNRDNSKEEIPEFFFAVNEQIFKNGKPASDLEVVKHITLWLKSHIKGGPGLSFHSEDALKAMLDGEGGVCSDMAQIFNNFCVINDIKVREWGSTRGPFNKKYGGHSFNEVFSKELNKWVLIDVSYCIFFSHNDGLPLSVIEFYQLLRQGIIADTISFSQSNDLHADVIKKNYLNPNTTPFLICNYSNKTYDSFLKRTQPYVPVFVTHFFIFLMGKSYYYLFPLDDYRKIFS